MNPAQTSQPLPGQQTLPPAQYSMMEQITLTSRIPQFWPDMPRAWFRRMEATINTQKLSDLAKYDLVITKLDKEVVAQLTDILDNPPETDKYGSLKTRLLALFEESASRQVQKLIGEMELGDQRPSQLLRRMRELAREKVPDETLKFLWQSHLPAPVRAILAVTDSKDLDVSAAVADKVMESTGVGRISELKSTPDVTPGTSTGTDAERILGELARINARLTNLERGRSRQRDSDRNTRTNSRNRSQSKRKNPNWLCFYHFRYREKATKCVEPCNWKNGNQQSGNSGN